jgi:hypothetical protein
MSLSVVVLAVAVGACGNQPTASTTTSAPAPSTTLAESTTATTTTTTGALAPEELAEAELEQAMTLVRSTECASFNATRNLIETVDGDIAVDDMVVHIPLSGEEIDRMIATGRLFDSTTGAEPFTTADDDWLSIVHGLLWFNHRRNFQLFAAYQTVGIELTFGRRDGSTDDADVDRLSWNGELVTVPGGSELEFNVFSLFAEPPLESAVGEEAATIARERVIEWITAIEPVVANPFAVTELEPVAGDLPEVKNLLCVLVATEWSRADDAIQGHDDDRNWLLEHGDEVFTQEVAIHELLLAAEYLEIMFDHLARTDVDWYRADSVDLSQSPDGITSSTEYVELWRQGIADALGRYHVMINRDD